MSAQPGGSGNSPTRTDGRNVDERLGSLLGEASGLEAREPDRAFPTDAQRALEAPPDARVDSYYGLPIIKEPVWIATIPLYFYVGGLSGAVSVLGAAATSMGGGRMRQLAKRARWIATAGDVVSAALLISDLGRPARFFNMLRVFRPTSPMSIGSWTLTLSGAANTTATLFMGRRGPLGAIGAAGEYASAVLGVPMAGYTGVLITNTAVPAWYGARRSLPLLFMASAVASAASLLALFPATAAEAQTLRRFGLTGTALTLAASVALERECADAPGASRAHGEGVAGALWKASHVLDVVSLAAGLFPARSRTARIAFGVAGTLGAIALRFAVFRAGVASARQGPDDRDSPATG